MKRAMRSRLLLLLGVAVLVALALWQWRRDLRDVPGDLLALDPAAITQVTAESIPPDSPRTADLNPVFRR